MIKILESLGCVTKLDSDTLVIDGSKAEKFVVKDEFTKKVRSSVFMLGPLLSRFRRARVAYPGGCNIGTRPIDLHLKGLRGLGVKIVERHGFINCDGRLDKDKVIINNRIYSNTFAAFEVWRYTRSARNERKNNSYR